MTDLNGAVIGFGEDDAIGLVSLRMASAVRSAERGGAFLGGGFATTGPARSARHERAISSEVMNRLSAQLLDKATKRGLPNVRVEAWDASDTCTDLVAIASTDRTGQFTIALTAAQIRGLFPGRSPALSLRLFVRGDSAPESIWSALPVPAWRWNVGPSVTLARIEVDSTGGTTVESPTHSVVRGQVRAWTGAPIAGASVVARDTGHPEPIELGSGLTDGDGGYSISYLSPGAGPSLVVSAYEGGVSAGSGRLLVRSPMVCHAPPTLDVNLTVGGRYIGPSRYQQLLAALKSTHDLTALSPEQLEHLACRVNVDQAELKMLAAAQRAAVVLGIPDEALFGLMSAGLPMDGEDLLKQHPREVRAAFRRAFARNVVSPAHEPKVEMVIELFRAAVIDRVIGSMPNSMGEVLLATLGSTDARGIVDTYLRSEGDDQESVWRNLRARPGFAAGSQFRTAHFLVDVGNLSTTSPSTLFDPCGPRNQPLLVAESPRIDLWADYHVSLVTEVVRRRDMGLVRDASDLAKYSFEQWIELVTESGVPHATPGLSLPERIQNYATSLKLAVRQLYPTKAMAAAIAASPAAPSSFSSPAALTSFFNSTTNARFALGKTRVATYMARTTGALASIPESGRAAVVDDLKKLERLHKLTPDYSEIERLLENGIDSAAQIHELGPERLMQRCGFSSAAAARIGRNACAVAGTAAGLQRIYSERYNNKSRAYTTKPALSDFVPQMRIKADVKAPLSDWKTLFAESDVCDCAPCHSVYSPAAYLVDLLRFLESIDVSKNRTARDALLEKGTSKYQPRRPDIAKIDISCPNTDTPLPYVDLVNEILEHVTSALFAGSGQLVYPSHIRTTGTARDLLPAPEILHEATHNDAYTHLASQPYPWSLPFHFWLAEARAFLPQLGAPLHGIMQAFSPEGPPSAPSNDKSYLPPPYAFDTTTAWERLGLWESARDIVLDLASVSPPVNWGFKTSQSQWATELLKPLTFLDKSGLSYDELLTLLGSGFIRHFVATNAPNPYLYQAGPIQTCDLSKMSIKGLQGAPKDTWDVLHRFLRLQRRLGYSMDEMDVVVASLIASGTPASALIRDDAFLKKLAIVEHFHADRGLDLYVVSSWFGAIDTRRRGRPRAPSFFERVFQSRAVSLPVDSTFDLEDADGPATPIELANTTHLFGDHVTVLRGALGLSAKDFTLLTDDVACMAQVGTGAELQAESTLTLASLSKAHRLVTFARALALSITDFLALKRLFGDVSDPAGAALFTPENAFLFAQVVDRVGEGALAPADLLFVFYGHTTAGSKLVPKEARFSTLVQRLEAGLIAIRQAMPAVSIVDGALLLPVLQLLLSDESMIPEAHRILLGETVVGGDDAWFTDHLLPFFAHSDASTRFFGGAKLEAGPERTSYAYGQLKAFADSDKLIIQTLAADLAVPPDVAAVLLALVDDGASTPSTLVELCRLGAFDSTTGLFGDPPRLTLIDYTRLHRATAPARTLGISPGELIRLSVYGQGLSSSARLFDINALVHATVSTPVVPEEWFRRWLLLTELWKLRGELIGGPDAFLALLPSDPTDNNYDFVARVVAATGWALADVAALTSRLLGALPTPSDLPALALGLVRLRYAILTLRPFRTDAQTAIESWVTLGTASPEALKTNGASASIVRAVRARYGEDEWPDVARPLRDKVREGQRSALVDYLITSGYAKSADELYAWLLIDVEMGACMLTSRIKQAIGSVQTFVQRALMNLEPDVKLTTKQAREWTWMKHYRVWEANRKIFLYPENWIEPALRDDKTPFFTQLESDLRRGDVTDDNVEEAYVRYLEKLVDVASLEIVALHHEESDGAVHLIGRTFSDPHRYFYCVGRATSSSLYSRVWTPWEPLELDISSDHILLTVHNHRLHLLWAAIEEKPNSAQKTAKAGNNDDPASPGDDDARTHLEIRLAWSERKQDRWEAPRTSATPLSTEYRYTNNVTIPPINGAIDEYNLKPEDLLLGFADSDGGRLRIVCIVNLTRIFRFAAFDGHPFKKVGFFNIEPCRLDTITRPASPIYPIVASSKEGGTYYDATIKELERERDGYQDALDVIVKTIQLFNKDEVPQDLRDLENKCNAKIAELSQEIEAYKHPDQSEVAIVSNATIDNVVLTALSANDWSWNWSGQALKAQGTKLLNVQEGDSSADVRSLVKGIRSSSTVLRSLNFAILAFGESKVGRLPLVLSSTEGDLRGTSYLFARHFFTLGKKGQCRATNLFHPHACRFLTEVRASGVDALFSDRKLQMEGFDPIGTNNLAGTSLLHDWQTDAVDFDYGGLYSTYNWELFFHAPLLIATRLSANRRYEEAQKWFHRIFDPTQGIGEKGTEWEQPPYSFWRFRPFFENKDLATIQDELLNLSIDAATKGAKAIKALDEVDVDSNALAEINAQIDAWRADPFKPHVIARMRPLAYQKAVLIKYIENLISWGDDLFRRDTIESITEATQLYILGRGLLGSKPRKIQPATLPLPKTAGQLTALDAFGDALVETESLVPSMGCGSCVGEPPPRLFAQYFCVPGNDKLTELWDTIADRLFKIRNCMNIEGVVRDLALFEPPIDPALLVLAAAAGVDINSVLNDLSAGTLPYRFQVVHGRAMELAAGVASLGQSLLQVLEKGDGEALARMRSMQEIEVLQSARRSRVLEVKEAEQALAVAQAAQAVIEGRLNHYEALVARGWSSGETGSLIFNVISTGLTVASAALSSAASGAAAIPDMSAGVNFGPQTLNRLTGGDKIALGLRMGAESLALAATAARGGAEALATTASYERRSEEWAHQVQLAKAELRQSAKQIATAQIRVAVASAALDTHELQTENAKAVDEFMRRKLTNEDLYEWMSDRIMDIYYEAYKLAYDMAKRAEKAFQTELAIEGAPKYITFGYWDSAKQGLTAGEQLLHALRGLDVAYHEQNKRELEITKHVSLAQVDPISLLKLRGSGAADKIELDERLFAFDYPSHYLRRLKHVSITVSGVAGPFTGVNCALTLTSSKVRRKPSLSAEPVALPGTIQTIVTSSGQADSGLFQPDLRDERYLPFEGAGAAPSTWRIELPTDTNAIDLATVTDVVLHLQYTARDGGKIFGDQIRAETWFGKGNNQRTSYRLIDLRRDRPDDWEIFRSDGQVDVALPYSEFPRLSGGKKISLTKIEIFLKGTNESVTPSGLGYVGVVLNGSEEEPNVLSWVSDSDTGTLRLIRDELDHEIAGPTDGSTTIDSFRLRYSTPADASLLKDIFIVLEYNQKVG